jgi:hypothetical protein
MLKNKCLITSICVVIAITAHSQVTTADTIPLRDQSLLMMDTTMDYDDLLDDLGDFLDSLLAPRSYLLASLSAGGSYFKFKTRNYTEIYSRKKFVITPTIGYYHKSGAGITFSGRIARDTERRRLYQYSITPSFDFIQSRKAVGGFSYTRYITKDSLSFYTSPLQNELSAYFLYRRSWIQPGIAANYGWGSRKDLQKRVRYIQLLNTRQIGTVVTTINTEEDVADFSLTASLRHSFYWLDLSENKDYIKFTPMIAFESGTQRYGFNQTTGTYASTVRNTGDVKYNSGNVNLDDKMKFQPLSVTLYLRPEYSVGKFFIQPQVLFDYYFPADSKNFTTLFSVNTGFMF